MTRRSTYVEIFKEQWVYFLGLSWFSSAEDLLPSYFHFEYQLIDLWFHSAAYLEKVLLLSNLSANKRNRLFSG